CVHLGGGEAGVAEELLHHPDVGAPLQHVRRARVAQDVRRQTAAQAGALPRRADDLPAALPAQPATARVQDHGLAAAAAGRAVGTHELRAAGGEVGGQRLAGRASDWDDAFLAALAEDAHQAIVEVEVAPV